MTGLQLLFATIGALVGVAGLSWTIYRHHRDKGKLRVELNGALLGTNPPTNYIVVSATNVGSRPIVVHSFKLIFADGKFVPMFIHPADLMHDQCDKLPKRLESGEIAKMYMQAEPETLERVKTVIAFDTTGKAWKS